MAHGVDAGVERIQVTRLDSGLNCPSPKSQIKKLPPRHNPVLPLR